MTINSNSRNPNSQILQNSHHSHLITFEIFWTAAAFPPHFRRKFFPLLSFEPDGSEKILRQGKRVHPSDAQLFGILHQVFGQFAAQSQMLVIRVNRQCSDLGDVVPRSRHGRALSARHIEPLSRHHAARGGEQQSSSMGRGCLVPG